MAAAAALPLVADSAAPPFDAERVAALPPQPQGGVTQPYSAVGGTQGLWLASDFASDADWTVQLTPAHIEELEAAIGSILRSGRVRVDAANNDLEQLTSVTDADFKLPTLGPLLHAVGKEVNHGRGFALVRRLPVERWTRAETLVAYWVIGLHWGVPMPQNEKQHLIGHVKVRELAS